MSGGALLHELQARRSLVAAGVFLAGLVVGCIVYVSASPADGGEQPEDLKAYDRQMELYGGKANLLAEEFREWFDGLWEGRSLGLTLAFLSAVLAGGLRLALTPGPPPGRVRQADEARRSTPP